MYCNCTESGAEVCKYSYIEGQKSYPRNYENSVFITFPESYLLFRYLLLPTYSYSCWKLYWNYFRSSEEAAW